MNWAKSNFVFRISKQEGSYHEERIAKIEEWQTKSAPLEQLFSDQGTKWEVDDVFESSDLEALRKYKQTTQVRLVIVPTIYLDFMFEILEIICYMS